MSSNDDTGATIQRVLGRIEGKLDGIAVRIDGSENRMSKLEDRVSLNEKRWWQMGAAGATLMTISTFILRYTEWIR